MTATTIDEVISILATIIKDGQNEQSPLGYFAALYQKVTQKVKDGIEQGFFEDAERMERLDVIFANRYLTAYFAYEKDEPTSLSWVKAFDMTKDYWPIVLQHLLLGMNAHISLDLGIAAAEVSDGSDIEQLKSDFDKINEILSSLVTEVENELSYIWPTLKTILKYTQKVDGFLVDFSMEIARNAAWRFAKEVHATTGQARELLVTQKDEKVSRNANLIVGHNLFVKIIFGIMRLSEKGSVAEKIGILKSSSQ